MKKVFKLQDLDCGHCAQQIEDGIAKLSGVDNVKVNFLGQRLTLEAADDVFHSVLAEAHKLIKVIEPDVTLVV